MDKTKKPQKSNPRHGANFLSQLLFLWSVPLLFKGSRKGLNTGDLTVCLDKDESTVLGDRLESEWYKEIIKAKKNRRKPLLKYALFQTFKRSCYVDGFLTFCSVFTRSIVPVILAQFLVQFQKPITMRESIHENNDMNSTLKRTIRSILNETSKNDVSSLNSVNDIENKNININTIDSVETTIFFSYVWNDVYWLSSGVVFMTLLCCFLIHHTDLRQRMLGARMRIACCSLVYRKVLRMSKKAAGQTPTGYLVNLLSNDVGRLDYGFIFAHYIWILPFQSVFICYLLYREIGIASVVGVIGLLIKTVPVQTALSKLSSVLRLRVAERTDQRVGVMNEIIQGIQVIKMYAWEKPFAKVVAEARRLEIKQIRYASYIRGIHLSTMVFIERSTLFISIVACVYLNKAITADVVFSMAQFFNILQLTAAIFYPLALSLGAEALVSINRVQEFLLHEERDTLSKKLIHNKIMDKDNNMIELINVKASWNNTRNLILNDLSISVRSGKLCAIIGPVGSGKSSLLQLLLGEMPISSGEAIINGELSYGSQEPWLFTGTVRNNILFGLEYNKERYNDVIRCCALLTDFEQFPEGDRTIVGERGTSLSGGQKARISLARSVYKDANIYLLDDPLSAVDAHVGRHLFKEVIGPEGYLAQKGTTRLLITHQIHFLKEADWIIIIDNGQIINQGTYIELQKTNLDFGKLLHKSDEKSENVNNEDIYEYDDLSDIPYIDDVDETSNGYIALLKRPISRNSSKSIVYSEDNTLKNQNEEGQATGNISYKIFKSYFLSGSTVISLILLLVVIITSQIIISGSDYFVNYWTQQEFLRLNNQETRFSVHESLYIYGILICCVILMTILRGYMFFNLCMRASKNLHNRMFSSLLTAPMQFFDTNPSGRVLNRFSKDMGTIDELLPKAVMESIQITLVMIGIFVMIFIVNPLMIAALLFAIFFFGCILRLYLRPAQDLKRLEAITRSPVFSHLSATLTGLSTIRSNNIQPDKIIEEFDHLQDVHSSVWQTTMSANAALGLWLDCVSTAFVACVTFSFIAVEDSIFSGNVGLAISQSLILTGMVQYGIRQTADVLQQMTSVERVLEYTNLEKETSNNNLYKRQLPNNWPAFGKISFNRMSLRYDKNELPVLKNLDILIESCWKVGVVGRTGAGKSSLISALFRLSHIEGEILIDDVDTSSINLDKLRQHISIIPQDPVLFSASIRYNLDPFNLYTDADLWSSLTDVELKDSVKDLDFMVTASGSNFSVGQRQLICLARAILRKNKILVLDEATANVDPKTDALIQKTIREKFKDCTVLTVAHRLHTVMDSDRILVMDDGYAREYDFPHKLLQNPNSLFSSMVNATGSQESDELKRIAYEHYQKINNLA